MIKFAWLPLVVTLLVPVAARSAPASEFLTDAIKGDNSEIALGRVAARRGATPAVQSFGAQLQRDHRDARAQAVALARRMHLRPPRGVTSAAAQEQIRLRHLYGRDFDREFIRYMIDDHREDIAKSEEQAQTADGGTSQLARARLPTLREHLRMAQGLAQ